ncbi:MAG: hypothetical protein AB1726_08670 [Planctomycetota bacterium]
MQGSLCLHRGVLWVGRHAKTAQVRAFDLEGHPLTGGFSFRDPRLGRSVAAGIAVDEDRHLWVADTPSSRVRRFTAFGVEVGGIGLSLDEGVEHAAAEDAPGLVRVPVDVAVRGSSEELLLVVAAAGERRHAVQVFAADGRLLLSLRPQGDPQGRFQGVRRIALDGRRLCIAEHAAARVQVFRDGDHLFSFPVAMEGGAAGRPTALASAGDGRLVVGVGGTRSALLLFDSGGRLVRRLAGPGPGEGEVFEPDDVAIEPGADERRTRVVVLDRDGSRVQLFDLEGRALGVFPALAG